MPAKTFQSGKKGKGEKPEKYPSSHGSHTVMIDDNLTRSLLTIKDEDGKSIVVCRDEKGPYVTTEEMTKDCNKLADINRYVSEEQRLKRIKTFLPKDVDLSAPKEE